MKLTRGKRSDLLIVAITIMVVMAYGLHQRSTDARNLDLAKKRTAWTSAKTLLSLCKAYQQDTGDYPKTLLELVKPPSAHLPYTSEQGLLDPWARQFQYAYPGPHNSLDEPDLWSFGSNINDPNGIIGTWTIEPR